MKILTNIGWKSIRETSINRIIYLSAVLYSFRYPDESNIFKEDYMFTITLSGPEDPDIENALVNLESNDVIAQSEEGYKVSDNASFSFKAKQDLRKTEWFEDIAYIVGIYGEDKIYDFIFRDPEYREALQGNSISQINEVMENYARQNINIGTKDDERTRLVIYNKCGSRYLSRNFTNALKRSAFISEYCSVSK